MTPTERDRDPGASYEVEETDLVYRSDGESALLARLYRPRAPGPFPALLDVHGGAWNAGTRLQNAPIDRALAGRGLIVAAIDFRLAPAHPHPAALLDINYATRWLKARAADFGASPEGLGLLGSSSGGHQAVLSALRPRDRRYAALPLAGADALDASAAYVVACWPVLDPHARYLYAREVGRGELVRATEAYFGDEAAMREASPTLILEGDEPVELPAVLVVQATADANVPNRIVERFAAAYRARGGALELAVFPGAEHGFGNRGGPLAEQAIEEIGRFLAGQAAGVAPSGR
jgi:acetyl esterase/lipase